MSTKHKLPTEEGQDPSKRQKLSAENKQDSSKQVNSLKLAAVSVDSYHVGWICALPCELAAAEGMLDEIYEEWEEKDEGDHNAYVLGRIHKHNIVIASCPAGVYGAVPAANMARDMMRSFPSIRFGLMVGIGGAAPSILHDIRLGDVVISQPSGPFGGVIQFDRGKTIQNGDFERTGILNAPPTVLLTALAKLQANHEKSFSKVPDYISKMVEKFPKMRKGYSFQDTAKDFLYKAEYDHSDSNSTCQICDSQQLVTRDAREDKIPQFHYGNIASSNQVMRHGATRETLRQKLDVLCFEMEAAGIMTDFPCIVIRGICDYSDSHKNKIWQKYAAATAAAYAKEFLSFITPARISREKPILLVSDPQLYEVASRIDTSITQISGGVKQFRENLKQQNEQRESTKLNECHRVFKVSPYETFKNINPDRVPGTCLWALKHPRYVQWFDSPKDDLLWISADPGCGKSVLARSLVENELRSADSSCSVCHFFFKDNEQQNRLAIALCALLHQLFDAQPQLLKHAIAPYNSNGDKLPNEVDKLWDILINAATDQESHNVICLLDALDECRREDCQNLLKHLSDFYSKSEFLTSRSNTLKFLVTSRSYDHIQSGFEYIPPDLPTIRLSGEKENDQIHKEIDLVIRSRVAGLAKISSFQKKELERWLLGMRNRTYLWLHLTFDGIEKKLRKSLKLYEPIESLYIPSSIDDAYEKILSNIEDDDKTRASTILHIIIGARRPLTTSEMALALGLASQPNAQSYTEAASIDKTRLEEILPHICGLFIFINHSRIYLIHQTAKEFLTYKEGVTVNSSGWKYCIKQNDSEAMMAQICISNLLLKELDTLITNSKINPTQVFDDEEENKASKMEILLNYSVQHWAYHFSDSLPTTKSPLSSLALQLYKLNQIQLCFGRIWKTIKPYLDQPNMNHIKLAAFNSQDYWKKRLFILILVVGEQH